MRVYARGSGAKGAAFCTARDAARSYVSKPDDSLTRRSLMLPSLWMVKKMTQCASLPTGDQLLGYMEAADFGRAVAQFSASKDPFDLWFKKRMADVTGVDLNNIPPGFAPPELLSHYDVAHMQRV